VQLGLGSGNIRVWQWTGTNLVDDDGADRWPVAPPGLHAERLDEQPHLDGVLKSTSSVAPQTVTPTGAFIGTYNTGGGEYFGGQVDEVRVYKAALTASQIAALAAGRYSAVGGGATFTLGTAITVPGRSRSTTGRCPPVASPSTRRRPTRRSPSS